MKYFISDNHWGHKSIIKMSNRPFSNVDEMNEYMIAKWNSVVEEEDEVYYLGDFMFKMNPTKFVNEVLNRLNGKIYLLAGNHDEKYISKYKDRVEWVKDRFELKYDHEGTTYKFILDHYPLYSWKGMWRGTILLYGHTHNNTDDLIYETIGNKMNVNCEFSDYTPTSIIEIINKFNNK